MDHPLPTKIRYGMSPVKSDPRRYRPWANVGFSLTADATHRCVAANWRLVRANERTRSRGSGTGGEVSG
jgi:hypothetical protein